jgi:anthranilate synthase/aminodeoxychorismate synthase-like glutamine amidotransferase
VTAVRRPIVVVVDNYDSFTYNLVQAVAIAGGEPVVLRNAVGLADVVAAAPDLVMLSPGPGTVEDPASYGVCLDALRHFAGRVPILGVCLGHQAIGYAYGAKIRRLDTVRHGYVSQVRVVAPSALLPDVDSVFGAMRYHSLVVDETTLPPELAVTAYASDDGAVMAMEHTELPVYGVQFHPESIGTPTGPALIANFISQSVTRSGRG